MLDISGQCPGVIHTPLLQSPAAGTQQWWRIRGMSGMWGQAPYPGERPITGLKPLSVACSSDKMKVTWDQYQKFFFCRHKK